MTALLYVDLQVGITRKKYQEIILGPAKVVTKKGIMIKILMVQEVVSILKNPRLVSSLVGFVSL